MEVCQGQWGGQRAPRLEQRERRSARIDSRRQQREIQAAASRQLARASSSGPRLGIVAGGIRRAAHRGVSSRTTRAVAASPPVRSTQGGGVWAALEGAGLGGGMLATHQDPACVMASLRHAGEAGGRRFPYLTAEDGRPLGEDETPLLCPVCGRAFSGRQWLRHVRHTHLGACPHPVIMGIMGAAACPVGGCPSLMLAQQVVTHMAAEHPLPGQGGAERVGCGWRLGVGGLTRCPLARCGFTHDTGVDRFGPRRRRRPATTSQCSQRWLETAAAYTWHFMHEHADATHEELAEGRRAVSCGAQRGAGLWARPAWSRDTFGPSALVWSR